LADVDRNDPAAERPLNDRPREGEDSPGPRRGYPERWWTPIQRESAAPWEILPQDAASGEVVLSKRRELGLLSNFAATPFTFRGRRYASVEGFWQMMLHPEGSDDPRARHPGVTWTVTRDQVAAMSGFEAKAAGERGERNLRMMGIDWVSFEGRRFRYRSLEPGEHHALIVAAMREKIRQNADVRTVLLATGSLVLRPDHHEEPGAPPEWRYCEILMALRSDLPREGSERFGLEREFGGA